MENRVLPPKQKAVTFEITVGSADTTVESKERFDNTIKRVVGMQISADPNKNLPFFRGKIGVNIDGKEVVPARTPAEIFISGSQVEPDGRFSTIPFKRPIETQNGDINFRYEDKTNTNAAFTAYTVLVIFLCEYE